MIQMRPVTTAVRLNLDKALLALEKGLFTVSGGKMCRSLFIKAAKIPTIPTNVAVIGGDEDSTVIARLNSDGSIKNDGFRILSTTDLHLGDDPKLRNKTFQMLADQMKRAKPDLVIFTGDIILSKYQHIDCIQFAQLMEKLGIYWAIVFGNHEAQEDKGFFKYLLIKSVSDYPHCLTKLGDEKLYGYGNFAINICNGKDSMLQSLYFFDSGRDIRDEYRKEHGVPDDMKGYDFLKNSQIAWYRAKLAAVKAKYGNVKSMMYMHIPIKEYEHVIKPDGNGGFVFTGECEVLYGGAYESIGSSPFNSGMFDAILKGNSTQAVFSGHDHINDFCAIYNGVYLVYNQCGGYETYTMGEKFSWDEKDWQQGVTITDIAPDGSIKISRLLNNELL